MKALQYSIANFIGVALCLVSLGVGTVSAQTQPYSTGYFQNPYLFNPAMGDQQGTKAAIGVAYRKMGNVDGGPQLLNLTGQYGFSDRIGAGVHVSHERLGLIATTKLMGSFIYHLPVADQGRTLHFGLSMGGTMARLAERDIRGNLNDPTLYNFNNDRMRFDADFGLAYTGDGLTVQAAVSNLVSALSGENQVIPNLTQLFAAASYRWLLEGRPEGFRLEPMVAYRNIRYMGNYVDAGASIAYGKDVGVSLYGLYHSDRRATVGLGVDLQQSLRINASYSTQRAGLGGQIGSDFEIGLQYGF